MQYLYCAHDSPKHLAKMKVPIQQAWDDASESVFLFAKSGNLCSIIFKRRNC